MKTLFTFALTLAALSIGNTGCAEDRRVPAQTLDSLGLGGLTEMPEAEASQVRGRWTSFRYSNWGHIYSSTDTGNGYLFNSSKIAVIYQGEPQDANLR